MADPPDTGRSDPATPQPADAFDHGPGPLKTLAWLGLIVAAIFAITAMEAPFYFVDDRDPAELQKLKATYGVTPIHPDDVHIGAPWRYFGISVLWYISAGSAIVGVASLVALRSQKKTRTP